MSETSSAYRNDGLTLRQAALVAGFGYLLSPVTIAEFQLYPKIVIAGNPVQTFANIGAHSGTFAAIIVCYLVAFLEDVVIAWALFYLLAPVNRALSLLTAWFRLIYAAIVLVGLTNLVSAYRLVTTPSYAGSFGVVPLRAQVDLLLHAFRYDWSFSLIVFGVHLVLLGYLIYRSRYIPWIIGVILVLDGIAWIVDSLQPYFYPSAHLEWLFVVFFSELILMLWLLIFGWRLREPGAGAPNLGA
jgi:hypothetical protein